MDRYENFKLIHDISRTDYDLLTEKCKPQTFKNGDLIIVPGQVQRKLYFVNSGIQMAYFDSGRKTHVIAFTYFPNLLAIPEAISFQTPSRYFVTALTDSEMEHISFEELSKVFDQSQQIERLFRKMMELAFAGMINRNIELHSMTIEERYKAFCQRSAHLLHAIPHKYIASYLGIDPTNFSKLFNTVMI